MIARIESHRKPAPLHSASLYFHELERITAAWEYARALAHYPLADNLLIRRNALIAQIAQCDEQVVTK